jgi:hypothetical protein
MRRRNRFQGTLILLPGLTLLATATLGPCAAYAAQAPVGLGTDASYAVLGGSTVTNTGPSVLNGDLGLSPGSSVTGFPPGIVHGAKHVADAPALQAKSDLVIAYNDTAGRAPTASVAGDLVGRTLTAGVYKSTGPLGLTGTLTLNAQGNPHAVFIFQIAKTLITGSASRVRLIGGAQACNVFWQVGSSATLGTHSSFKGTIMALTSIAVQTGTVIQGRAMARNGAVTLDTNTITRPLCSTGSGGGGGGGGGGTGGGGGPEGGVSTGGGASFHGPDSAEIIGGSALLATVASGWGLRIARRRRAPGHAER